MVFWGNNKFREGRVDNERKMSINEKK